MNRTASLTLTEVPDLAHSESKGVREGNEAKEKSRSVTKRLQEGGNIREFGENSPFSGTDLEAFGLVYVQIFMAIIFEFLCGQIV